MWPMRPIALYLALLIAAVYANSLDIGFHFDDEHALERNPAIRSLVNVPRFFVDANTSTVLRENKDLRPILLTTFALNYAISGTAPWSWHLLNLLLHWITVVLVFRAVRDHLWLGKERVLVAGAAAIVVAVHPLATEALDYLSARSALLTTVLYLAAFDAGVRRRRLVCVVCFTLALLTKAIAITLPVVLLGHALLDRRRGERPVPWRLVATLAALAVAGLGYRALLVPSAALRATHAADMTAGRYFMTEWSAYLYYLRLFVWPDGLVVDRLDYPTVHSLFTPRAWQSLIGLVALGILAWRARFRFPALTFGAFWFAVTLAPESTFFPLAEPVNGHRPYLALFGLGVIAARLLWACAGLVARARLLRRAPAFSVAMTLVTIGLGVATVRRNDTWRDDYVLWLDAVAKAPTNPRAWLNAGHAAMAAGRFEDAERLLLEAHRMSPCYSYVLINLSAVAARSDGAASLRWADEAVACNPDLALTHLYRAAALERLGRIPDAFAEYERTTTIDDYNAEAWRAQARLLEQREAWADAASTADRAFAADPTVAEAAMQAGLLYQYRLHDPAAAVARYRSVLHLVPTHYGARYQLAVALFALGHRDEARSAWRTFEGMATAIGDRTSIEAAPPELRAP